MVDIIEDTITLAMKQAKASIQIEGFTISTAQTTLVESILRGEISEQEFYKRTLEIAGL